jgi:hypothetical protein
MGFIIFESHSAFTKRSAAAVDDNPQHFHLWATSNSIAFTFNCDPRAADEWLFRSAGGKMVDGQLELTNIPTNAWEHR